MADPRGVPRFDSVDAPVREPLGRLVERLEASLGANLKSISVVGSSLTPDFQPKVSDINTVVVLDTYDLPALQGVAVLVPQMRRHRLSPPLLLTEHYMQRSCDVFGVEFLDFQLVHATILGDDPFAALHFEKKNIRLQCERELKAMLVRLRQGYLASAGDRRLIRDLLISAAKGLTPLLRALLWLADAERPQTVDSTLRRAAGAFEVDLDAILAAHRWRQEKARRTNAEVESTFVTVLDAVDRLTTITDGMEL
jgi:hypothetical protein